MPRVSLFQVLVSIQNNECLDDFVFFLRQGAVQITLSLYIVKDDLEF